MTTGFCSASINSPNLINPPSLINLSNHSYHEPEALLLAPFFVVFMAAFYAAFFSSLRGAFKIRFSAVVLAVLAGNVFLRWHH